MVSFFSKLLGVKWVQIVCGLDGKCFSLFQVAMATGCVMFHRFFYSKSFVRYSMEVVAMGCVCLACKIEEAPRR